MSSSSLPFNYSPTVPVSEKFRNARKNTKVGICRKPCSVFIPTAAVSSPSQVLQKSVPLAASIAILLWSNPANAGILSGFSGLESVPGPQLPEIDFLTKFNEENQKKYAENDLRFKSSSILKELLEKSQMNKERHKKEIEDKYCIRGAEWGVGDCSTAGMTTEERDNFIAMLKQKSEAK